MLRLYDPATGRVEEIAPARAGVVRVSCAGGPRALLVGDLVRRLLAHHRVRMIGIWEDLPGAAGLNIRPADLNIRPAELTSGPADLRVGETVGRCSLASADGLDPLAVRLALLSRHYRADVSLGRDDLAGAEASLTGWRRRVAGWAESPGRPPDRRYVAEAISALDSDLDTPAALGVLSRLADDETVPPGARFETVVELDMILGLDLVRLVGRL